MFKEIIIQTIRKAALAAFLVLLPLTSFGYEHDLGLFISEIEQEVKSFDDEIHQKLYDYRMEVEKTSYDTTLKLCEGYRRAEDLSKLMIKAKLPIALKGLAPKPTGPAKYHGKYMYTAIQAGNEWRKVAYQGAKQSISNIGGLKANYIDAKNIGFFEFESWFDSLHAMYLVNSTGFLMGAMHCLEMNMMEMQSQRKISRFAAMVTLVDREASLAGHAATFWTGGKIISIMAKGLFKIAARPTAKVMSHITSRVKLPSFIAKNKKASFYTVAGIFTSYFTYKALKKRKINNEAGQVASDAFDQNSESTINRKRRNRFLTLKSSFELYLDLKNKEALLEESCGDCINHYMPLETYILENFDDYFVNEMKQDKKDLEKKPHLLQDEDFNFYYKLLNEKSGFLPVIQHFLNKENTNN